LTVQTEEATSSLTAVETLESADAFDRYVAAWSNWDDGAMAINSDYVSYIN